MINDGPDNDAIDLGWDHWMKFFGWHPDRGLNPQYNGIPDVEKAGVFVWHRKPDGSWCASAIHFDTLPTEVQTGPRWHLVQADPLSCTPSLLCRRCGDHGWIRDGKWVKA